MTTTNLQSNYKTVIEQIRAMEASAGRPCESVNLVAVSKLHPVESIRKLALLGQRAFGENFVQEAKTKQEALTDLNLEWHFIGHIQSNKTKEIANSFSWVHSVDRVKIARRLANQRSSDMPPLNICIQVNLQAEQTKSGASAAEIGNLAEEISAFENVSVRGLMIIPQPEPDPMKQRAVFAELRQLLETINERGYVMDTLSMGMTADMEAAISEGSTHVRIGTALFGPRPVRR